MGFTKFLIMSLVSVSALSCKQSNQDQSSSETQFWGPPKWDCTGTTDDFVSGLPKEVTKRVKGKDESEAKENWKKMVNNQFHESKPISCVKV